MNRRTASVGESDKGEIQAEFCGHDTERSEASRPLDVQRALYASHSSRQATSSGSALLVRSGGSGLDRGLRVHIDRRGTLRCFPPTPIDEVDCRQRGGRDERGDHERRERKAGERRCHLVGQRARVDRPQGSAQDRPGEEAARSHRRSERRGVPPERLRLLEIDRHHRAPNSCARVGRIPAPCTAKSATRSGLLR